MIFNTKKEDSRLQNKSQRLIQNYEYEKVLESSFLFPPERSGFFSVNTSKNETDKPVSQNECNPLAIF